MNQKTLSEFMSELTTQHPQEEATGVGPGGDGAGLTPAVVVNATEQPPDLPERASEMPPSAGTADLGDAPEPDEAKVQTAAADREKAATAWQERGCLRGCINPGKGLHHTKCPNYGLDSSSRFPTEGGPLVVVGRNPLCNQESAREH